MPGGMDLWGPRGRLSWGGAGIPGQGPRGSLCARAPHPGLPGVRERAQSRASRKGGILLLAPQARRPGSELWPARGCARGSGWAPPVNGGGRQQTAPPPPARRREGRRPPLGAGERSREPGLRAGGAWGARPGDGRGHFSRGAAAAAPGGLAEPAGRVAAGSPSGSGARGLFRGGC